MSPKQRETLEAIHRHIESLGMPPTIKELESSLGIGQYAVLFRLGILQKKGWIKRESRKARAIFITSEGLHMLGESFSDSLRAFDRWLSDHPDRFVIRDAIAEYRGL